MLTCNTCRQPKPEHEFARNGKWLKKICKTCRNEQHKAYHQANKEHLNEYARSKRQEPEHVPRHILVDSRRSDKKRGFDNDLTLEFVRVATSGPCSYCGEATLRMTLDRIDNDLGHLQGNVRAACIRCNYMRGSMPYDAWLCLVPSVIIAREQGLFRSWSGRARKPR